MSDLTAAAEALAPEVMPEAAPEAATPAAEAPPAEPTEDEALDAVWERLNAPEAPPEPEKAGDAASEPESREEKEPEAPDEGEEKPAAPEAAASEGPNGLPRELREKWSEIPEALRPVVEKSHRDLQLKLTQQGREMQGIAPIRDVLTEAVKDLPALARMTPQEIARDVAQLAKLSNDFHADPVASIVGLIDKHDARGVIMQALGAGEGEVAGAAAQQEIAALKQEVAQLRDPAWVRSQFGALNAEQEAQRAVTEFSTKAEHWAEVETDVLGFLPGVQAKMGPGASLSDILQKAYDIAVHANGLPVAKAGAAAQAAPQPDPQRTQQAVKAKSINVRSQPTQKNRVLTEDEELDLAWERAQKS